MLVEEGQQPQAGARQRPATRTIRMTSLLRIPVSPVGLVLSSSLSVYDCTYLFRGEARVCVLHRGPKGKARAQGCVRARKRALHSDRRSLSVCRYVLASQCTLSLALSVYVRECVWLFALTNLPLGRRAPARGTRLRSRSSHRGRVRRVGRCTHAGPECTGHASRGEGGS